MVLHPESSLQQSTSEFHLPMECFYFQNVWAWEFDVIIGATVEAPWATVWASCEVVTGVVASLCVPDPMIVSQSILS